MAKQSYPSMKAFVEQASPATLAKVTREVLENSGNKQGRAVFSRAISERAKTEPAVAKVAEQLRAAGVIGTGDGGSTPVTIAL